MKVVKEKMIKQKEKEEAIVKTQMTNSTILAAIGSKRKSWMSHGVDASVRLAEASAAQVAANTAVRLSEFFIASCFLISLYFDRILRHHRGNCLNEELHCGI